MDQATALSGLLRERNALEQPEGVFNPSYISEHMQILSQYISALDMVVSERKEMVEKREAELFKEYTQTLSVNAAQTKIKYELAAENAEINRLQHLCNTSWRFISVSQSRIKHLIEEAKNQI